MKPLTDRQRRLEAILAENGGSMQFEELAKAMFPKDRFPHAWHSSTRGGAPGCYLSLTQMIKRLGLQSWGPKGTQYRQVALPGVVPPGLEIPETEGTGLPVKSTVIPTGSLF